MEVAMEKHLRELQINSFQKITLNSAKGYLLGTILIQKYCFNVKSLAETLTQHV